MGASSDVRLSAFALECEWLKPSSPIGVRQRRHHSIASFNFQGLYIPRASVSTNPAALASRHQAARCVSHYYQYTDYRR
jgi:hypothetical protein